MTRRALICCTLASQVKLFNADVIAILQEAGYAVEVACGFADDVLDAAQLAVLRTRLQARGIACHDVRVPRDPRDVGGMVRAYRRLCSLVPRGYALVHCQSPIAGALCRAAFRCERERGTTVVYAAHGFHFHRGASPLAWLAFYPVERLCARWTDALVTINGEDCARAQRLAGDKVRFMHGAGVDCERFSPPADTEERAVRRRRARARFGLPEDAVVWASVGELNANKNHELVIRVLAKMASKAAKAPMAAHDAASAGSGKAAGVAAVACGAGAQSASGADPIPYYVLVGAGALRPRLEARAAAWGVADRVRFLGFQDDVRPMLEASDVFVLPSRREGLPVALMEAMAMGLPTVVSDVRGCRDLVRDGAGGFVARPRDRAAFAAALERLSRDAELRRTMGARNRGAVQAYSRAVVNEELRTLFAEVERGRSHG